MRSSDLGAVGRVPVGLLLAQFAQRACGACIAHMAFRPTGFQRIALRALVELSVGKASCLTESLRSPTTGTSTRKVMYNLPVEDMHAPVLGEKAWVSLARPAGLKESASTASTIIHVVNALVNMYDICRFARMQYMDCMHYRLTTWTPALRSFAPLSKGWSSGRPQEPLRWARGGRLGCLDSCGTCEGLG